MTTTTQPGTVESRIAALEKRLTQLAYKRGPAPPATGLALRRAEAADIWIVTDSEGRVYMFLSYFEEVPVGGGKAIPSVLVSGDVCGVTFTPHDDRFPPFSHPDYVGLG